MIPDPPPEIRASVAQFIAELEDRACLAVDAECQIVFTRPDGSERVMGRGTVAYAITHSDEPADWRAEVALRLLAAAGALAEDQQGRYVVVRGDGKGAVIAEPTLGVLRAMLADGSLDMNRVQ